MMATADAVSRYIAERVIERERIMAGDFEDMRTGASVQAEAKEDLEPAAEMPEAGYVIAAPADSKLEAQKNEPAKQPAKVAEAKPVEAAAPARTGGAGLVLGTSWFILGCVAGAAALVVAFWDRLSAMIN